MSSSFLTASDLHAIERTLHTQYRADLGRRKFTATAQFDTRSVKVGLLLRSEDDSFFYPVEGMVKRSHSSNLRDDAFFLFDYLGLYFEEFFGSEEEDVTLPLDWAAYEYEGREIYLRGQIRNQRLEKMADDILAGLDE